MSPLEPQHQNKSPLFGTIIEARRLPRLMDANPSLSQIRKANLNVKVVDTNNNPVPGASVQITQTKTSFPMGGSLQSQITSTPAYQQFFTSLFNTAGKLKLSVSLNLASFEARSNVRSGMRYVKPKHASRCRSSSLNCSPAALELK